VEGAEPKTVQGEGLGEAIPTREARGLADLLGGVARERGRPGFGEAAEEHPQLDGGEVLDLVDDEVPEPDDATRG
jgi:hypothetical protein